MSFILVYLKIYARSLTNALAAIAKNVWTLALPMGLMVAFFLLGGLLSGGGYAGGMLLGLARSAALSIYLYFAGQLIGRQRTGLSDLKTAIGAYFWSSLNLFFVLWIIDLLLATALFNNPQAAALKLAVTMLELLVLNAAPETMYLKGTRGGLETIQRSIAFLQENWIEWFVPNGLILAFVYFLGAGLFFTLASFDPFHGAGVMLLLGALLHVVMVFRGFLFEALDGSTHRQRMYRFKQKS